MKLGYYYQVTANGASSKELIINGGDWCSIVDDERTLWTKYAIENECIALTLVNDGIVIPVVKILGGGRTDNNVATWIFVPTKIKVYGYELQAVIDEIKLLYHTGTRMVTEDSFLCNPILGKDYSEKRFAISIHRINGNQLAYRLTTGDWTQKEILDKPFQDYYGNYKYVFLFNQIPSDITELENLSDRDIKEVVTVLQPSDEKVHELFGEGNTTIYIDDKPFNSPIYRVKGSELKLTAVRTGYQNRIFMGQATRDEEEAQYSLSDNDWRKILTGKEIVVKDVDSEHIIHAQVNILNPEWDENSKTLPEDCLSSVNVRIKAIGYQDAEKIIDLTQSVQTVYLETKKEKAEYSCQTLDGRKLKISIIGKGARSNHPFDGYKVEGKSLYYEDRNKNSENYDGNISNTQLLHRKRFAWKEFCYGIIFTVLFALVCWVISYGLYQWIKPSESTNSEILADHENSIDQDDELGIENHQDSDVNHKLGLFIAYLDANDKWEKDSLEKYSEPQGLYTEMNTYDLKKIMQRENNLKSSQNFKKLLTAIRDNQTKTFNGTFCNNGDYSITVSKYIDKLYRSTELISTPTSGEGVSDAVKKAQKSSKAAQQNSQSTSKDQKPQRGGV